MEENKVYEENNAYEAAEEKNGGVSLGKVLVGAGAVLAGVIGVTALLKRNRYEGENIAEDDESDDYDAAEEAEYLQKLEDEAKDEEPSEDNVEA